VAGPPAPAAGDDHPPASPAKKYTIRVTDALQGLLWSQIETHCAAAETGDDHNTLYLKIADAGPGDRIHLTEAERRELWSVCDYIDECWDDNPADRRLARAWRDRIATPSDRRSA
jgi:hypothetical protein